MSKEQELLQLKNRVFYGVESLNGVLEWSIGVERSQILEWQKYLFLAHKIVYSMKWSPGAEYWNGVRFWRGQSRMECSCDMCVCGQVLCNLEIVIKQ